MENRKKLKRLVLKKEEIVNLNDYQMKEINDFLFLKNQSFKLLSVFHNNCLLC